MAKISVIMPCLNMAKYIKQCLDSVIHQTLTSLEILIIDAGSTDGTQNILKDYARHDSRIKVLYSDKKSYGFQVNMGLYYASGDYISIVDTDDIIVPDMYETLYQKAVMSDADYVKGTAKGFYTLANEEKYYYSIAPFNSSEYKPEIELVPKENPSLLTKDNFLWYGLYKSAFLKQIRLNESPGAAFQDFGALFQILTNANKAIYISKPIYYYRQDNTNASTYNHNGFLFIAEEYTFAENFLSVLSFEWHTAYYQKLFLHLMNRINEMASSGSLWNDALQNIKYVSDKLRHANVNGFLTEHDLNNTQWADLQLLLENPYLLYTKSKQYYQSGKSALRNAFHFFKNSPGIIFGNGKYGQFLHAQFLHRGYKNIVAYCDNFGNVQGTYQYNIKVLSPEQAIQKFPKAKYIIANKYYIKEMKNQLISLGVEERDIFIYAFGTNLNLFSEIFD